MATPSFSSIAGGITDVSQASSSTLADQPASNSVIPEAIPQPVAAPAPGGEAAAPAEEPAPPVKRPVGRPKGSKNKTHQAPLDLGPVEKRPVGRPRGSGKPKVESVTPVVKRPVGRPRKDGLPPGSTKTTFSTLVPPTSDYRAQINQWVPFTASISAPVAPPPPPPPAPVIDPALQRNEWAELAHSKPEEFLQVLLAALDTPNSPSLTGPSVEEAFKSHLGSLAPPPSSSAPNSANGAPTQPAQSIPSLYSILKTFWLPSSPSYFALTASATSARTPSSHRFLYWDPQPLVFNGIACPTCASPLINRGRIRTGPITVHDLAGPFFVIGCAYTCPNNHVYASTDAAVRRALPAALEREFPARLLAGDTGVGADVWNWQARGVSRALWHLVLGALRANLTREVILQLVRGVQQGVPESAASDEDDAQGEPADADGEAAPMEEEESAEEAAHGQEQNQAPAQGEAVVGAAEPTVASATQAFNDAWTANSVITSMDVRNNPLAYARFALPMFPQAVHVPGAVPQDPLSRKRPYPFGDQDAGTSAGSTGVNPTADGSASTPPTPAKKTRNPRHCCKCGSQLCKGKGGRNFCTNPCMDCGKFECPGRSSRRPDKRCDSAWPEGQPQVQDPLVQAAAQQAPAQPGTI
ncbi:hypothetical protein MSAN_00417100 [Mycena sanguinolenta]|uniref:Uncharacterized protein n=1 Tax=Mycena sanguinolenta TaxID=230812 RepID=A0A8H6ZA40_9AGAR|nr:hypothetical protein MSAN_00417100 [Mycena sanguinolenta]